MCERLMKETDTSRSKSSSSPEWLPDDDWLMLATRSSNAVIVGPIAATREVIERLTPDLAAPITRWNAAETMPTGLPTTGTVIVEDVMALDHEGQRFLVDHIHRCGSALRVLATSPLTIFPLVQGAVFSEQLYYRLNTLYLVLAL